MKFRCLIGICYEKSFDEKCNEIGNFRKFKRVISIRKIEDIYAVNIERSKEKMRNCISEMNVLY